MGLDNPTLLMGSFHGQPHQAAAKLEGQGHNFSKQMHRSDADENGKRGELFPQPWQGVMQGC